MSPVRKHGVMQPNNTCQSPRMGAIEARVIINRPAGWHGQLVVRVAKRQEEHVPGILLCLRHPDNQLSGPPALVGAHTTGERLNEHGLKPYSVGVPNATMPNNGYGVPPKKLKGE